MEIDTVGSLVALFIVGILLTTGCTSLLSSGDDQTHTGTYPPPPFEIVSPIQYQGDSVNESDIAVTMLVLNLTVTSRMIISDSPEMDPESNITKIYIRYTDGQDLYLLEPGDYSIARWENGDDDNTLGENEIIELTLPLQQPVPANTTVYAEFWIPYYETLTLSFRTPEVIELSGQVTEFVAAPFVPY